MKWIRNILKGASLTTALFIFQACYGIPQDMYDRAVEFKVVDRTTGDPVKGVNVYFAYPGPEIPGDDAWFLVSSTSESGVAEAGVPAFLFNEGGAYFRFVTEDKSYSQKDTLIVDLGASKHVIELQK